MSRRPRLLWVLFLLLLIVPIAEITVIVMIGRVIGGWQTFGLLVVWSLLGAWIVKREWRTAWTALRTALQTGRMPAKELADAALVLVGGVLLLTPGFITDAVGLFLILPFTRPISRALLQAAVARRVLGGNSPVAYSSTTAYQDAAYYDGQPTGGPQRGSGTTGSARGQDEIIEGEIVEE